jgi:UDP-N-acetylglucosamine 2-epimerase (non-hydrolysing)
VLAGLAPVCDRVHRLSRKLRLTSGEKWRLGKPTLVMWSNTERPEAISAGTALLVGTARDRIVSEAERLLRDEGAYRSMASCQHPFGDGYAARRILDILVNLLAR